MTTRPRTGGAALLALVLLVGASACSNDNPPRSEPADGGDEAGTEKGVGDDFPAKGAIISATCTPGTVSKDTASGTSISVDAWEPGKWEHLAHTEFRLPEGTVVSGTADTAMSELCDPEDTGNDFGSVSTVKSLFDKELTKIAVVTKDDSTEETHVGYVDREGKFTDLTGEGGFGDDPQEQAAAFSPDGDTIWLTYERYISYEKGSKIVVARRSVAGDHELVDRFEEDFTSEALLTVVGPPNKAVLGFGAYLSPDGRHIATADGVVPTPKKDVLGDEAAREKDIGCRPVGWLGKDKLLCEVPNNFVAAGLASKAELGSSILPENTHENFAMAISPDGAKFTFVSGDGEKQEHWISDTSPGSTPEKIKPGGDFAALGGTPIFFDWR